MGLALCTLAVVVGSQFRIVLDGHEGGLPESQMEIHVEADELHASMPGARSAPHGPLVGRGCSCPVTKLSSFSITV